MRSALKLWNNAVLAAAQAEAHMNAFFGTFRKYYLKQAWNSHTHAVALLKQAGKSDAVTRLLEEDNKKRRAKGEAQKVHLADIFTTLFTVKRRLNEYTREIA